MDVMPLGRARCPCGSLMAALTMRAVGGLGGDGVSFVLCLHGGFQGFFVQGARRAACAGTGLAGAVSRGKWEKLALTENFRADNPENHATHLIFQPFTGLRKRTLDAWAGLRVDSPPNARIACARRRVRAPPTQEGTTAPLKPDASKPGPKATGRGDSPRTAFFG